MVNTKREQLGGIQEKLSHSEFKGALLSSEDHIAFINEKVSPNLFYHYTEEIVSVFNLCFYMHKQSCLTHEVNGNIMKLTSSGLIQSWAKIFADRSYLIPKLDISPKQLDNSKLNGAYMLLIYGFGFSLFVFIIEILCYRIKCLHRVMKNL